MERGSVWRPNVEIAPSCPRCGSSNTKFCYYNNYSLTQPRYFCKGCRRYWTKGGSLRNVPVGGGCRKSRRGKSSIGSNSNGKNFANCYNGNNRGESSGSGGSNIDLALVYANFLNPRPDDNPNLDILHTDHHDSSEFHSKVAVELNSGLLPQLEIPNSTSLAELSPEIANRTLFTGFESVNSNNNQENGKNQVQECNMISQGMAGSYGLPPLPGEETVLSINHLHQENFVWSDSASMENHGVNHVQTVQEPVHFGDGTEDPANLLFGNWSPFDFSSDDTFFRT